MLLKLRLMQTSLNPFSQEDIVKENQGQTYYQIIVQAIVIYFSFVEHISINLINCNISKVEIFILHFIFTIIQLFLNTNYIFQFYISYKFYNVDG